jgi:hypothetical protein
MQAVVRKEDVKKLVGQDVLALKRDGSLVSGKLVRLSGNQLIIRSKGKDAKTSAVLPLALFDLLAIGTAPYAYGGFYGGFPGAFYGYPGFFW